MSNAAWPFIPGNSPAVVRAEGSRLYRADGSAILDAAGGAIVVNVGHGRQEVVDRLAAEALNLTYAVPPWSTPSREALVRRLQRAWLPAPLSRVHLASGGSEANESAMKIAIQYQAARGEPQRHVIIGRDLSYHGTTISTAAVGGHAARRRPIRGLLPEFPKAPTPYPLRSPLGRHHPDAGAHDIAAFEAVIREQGPERIAAFIAEPVSGSSGGAIVPPPDYWPAVRALCDRHGILLIIDEVMTGFGRTGRRFACEHFGLVPDLLVGGKGLAGGYAPICGIFASEAIASTLAAARQDVMFHTYGALPSACAAADAVLAILERDQLVERAAAMGDVLARLLEDAFGAHRHVAECRGLGLLRAIEVVADRDTLEPFPEAARVTSRIVARALELGVFVYPGGTGVVRDILCLGPPFTVSAEDLATMVDVLRQAVDDVTAQVTQGR